MLKIFFQLAYIPLEIPPDVWWSQIQTRTEIRKAQKNGVSVEFFSGVKTPELITSCLVLQEQLFERELIPFQKGIFQKILEHPDTIIAVAKKDGEIISCISIDEQKGVLYKEKKVGRLATSATNNLFSHLCPNYLLIWEATTWLRNHGYGYFNLDLLNFVDCPDPDLERVAFFKKKWAPEIVVRQTQFSIAHYVYVRFLKRYHVMKSFVYAMHAIKNSFFRPKDLV